MCTLKHVRQVSDVQIAIKGDNTSSPYTIASSWLSTFDYIFDCFWCLTNTFGERETDRQTDRPTDRQTETETDTHRDSEMELENFPL